MMKPNEGQRAFLDKVAHDNREYMQSLLDENHKLKRAVAELEIERDHTHQALTHALAELTSRERMESVLKERVAAIEEESRTYSARYVEVEQQNTNLANLYVASYQLHGTLDRERVIAAIQEIVINLVGSEELAIWECVDELSTLALIGSFGIDENEWAAVPYGIGIVGDSVFTGERFIGGFGECGEGREETITACIPLKLDERVVGVIGIFRLLPQKAGLEPLDYELFELLASHAASALRCTALAAEQAVTV